MLSQIRFSTLQGLPLQGSSGNRVGRLADCVVRLLDRGLPQLTGIVSRLEGRDIFVPARDLMEAGEGGVRITGDRVDVRPFERRPGEVLLGRDVVGRAVIDVVEGRLIRVADLLLEGGGAEWQVVAAIPSTGFGLLRRLLSRDGGEPPEQVEWRRIEPLVGHVPTAARHLPFLRLAALKPADIADIVEEASHEEGQEILDAVHQDRELEADVFEELDEDHQVEFIRERSDAEAAKLLAEMAPDDAADLLMKLDQDRRRPILELVPRPEQEQMRRLLGYNAETAGGLMSTDVIAIPDGGTVADAIASLRARDEIPDTLSVLFTVDGGRLAGAASMGRLLRAEPSTPLIEVTDRDPVAVFPEADLPSIAVEMADYNLSALPVVDQDGSLLGAVTYDDIIEAMLPDEWRWRGDANQEHRYEPAAEPERVREGEGARGTQV